jgi:MFS family permease
LAAIYGLGSIGVTPLESTITAELFGIKAHGAILGLVSAGFTVGGAVGPLLSGYWFDRNGNYQLSFLICAVAGALGLILLLALRPLNKHNEMAKT